METIKVNMNPNPLDVQTIHASQNDGEARQWGFELHNNGEIIDSSEITDQMVFKAYKGGTEQILPENTSTPTTSPFKGDIKYPQGLLSDQEFTYRQSPTEEDGLAKITDVKGNTLVWNQLVQNGNFADTSIWSVTGSGSSFTVSNNIATVTASGAYDRIQQNVEFINGHKYLFKADIKKTNANDDIRLYYGTHLGAGSYTFANTTEWQTRYIIRTASESTTSVYPNIEGITAGLTWQQRNMMIIDLTQMGLDITDPSDFTSLFSLPYYSYKQGTLLSFMGNGIKTVGKNLLSFPYASGSTSTITVNNDGSLSINKTASGDIYFNLYAADNGLKLPSGDYIIKSHNALPSNVGIYCVVRLNGTTITNISLDRNNLQRTINIPNGAIFICYMQLASAFIGQTEIKLTMSVEDMDAFEPYTSSTLSLPISTYFPNGMDGVGTAYDELTNTKATTRMTRTNLGSLTWNYITSGSNFAPYFWASFTDIKSQGNPTQSKANIMCSKYITVKRSAEDFVNGTICADGTNTAITQIQIKDSSFTDATAFKESLQGVYLCHEMVNETETSFTTASLVTENAEIPLSNEDGVLIGKCTEQLSAEPGFHDAKIKLADDDGECYSNKIQLHVERKPS